MIHNVRHDDDCEGDMCAKSFSWEAWNEETMNEI